MFCKEVVSGQFETDLKWSASDVNQRDGTTVPVQLSYPLGEASHQRFCDNLQLIHEDVQYFWFKFNSGCNLGASLEYDDYRETFVKPKSSEDVPKLNQDKNRHHRMAGNV